MLGGVQLNSGQPKPTFLLVIPLEEEFAFITKAFGGERTSGPDGYEVFTLDSSDYLLIYFCVRKMGNIRPALATTKLLSHYKPDMLVVFGVGGSLAEDLEIGSIAVSDSIFYYESAKITDDKHEYRGLTSPVTPLLVRLANTLGRQLEFPIRIGLFAVGEKVIAGDEAKREILAAQPKTIVVEMESEGVREALEDSTVLSRFIAIRCISDKADKTKDDHARANALSNGVIFIRAFFALVSETLQSSAEKPKDYLVIHHTSQGSRPAPQLAKDSLNGLGGCIVSIFDIDQNQFFDDGRIHPVEDAVEELAARSKELVNIMGGELKGIGYFGLANVPFALALGYELQRVQIDFFEVNRFSGIWGALSFGGPASVLGVISVQFAAPTKDAEEAVLKVEISSNINDSDLTFLDPALPRYSIRAPSPQADLIATREHLDEVARVFRKQLNHIKADFPSVKKIHLFAAVSPSCALSLGQQIKKTDDPVVIVYNYSRKDIPAYAWGIELGSFVVHQI